MIKFLVGSCEQHPMLRDGTVLRSTAVPIGITANRPSAKVRATFPLMHHTLMGALHSYRLHRKLYLRAYIGKLDRPFSSLTCSLCLVLS